MIVPTPICGRVSVAPGRFKDFETLARFHYIPRRPGTPADIVAAWHQLPGRPARCIAVGVLSWPTALHAARQKALDLNGLPLRQRLKWVNEKIRTISRVIVHPTYRSIGLSSVIVRALIVRCPTRYIETSAMMARAAPLFDCAGMRRINPPSDDQPIYFLFDRWRDPLPRFDFLSRATSPIQPVEIAASSFQRLEVER